MRASSNCRAEPLVRYLPRVDDLCIHDILLLCDKYGSELSNFRRAVASLATEIDLDESPGKMAVRIQDLVTTRVDPEIARLSSALSDGRRNALKMRATDLHAAAHQLLPVALAVLVKWRILESRCPGWITRNWFIG